jgi:hypothetical protein
VRDPTAPNRGQACDALLGALARKPLPSFGTSRQSPNQTSRAAPARAQIGMGHPPSHTTRPITTRNPRHDSAPSDRAPPRRRVPMTTPAEYPRDGDPGVTHND